jgi:hypothetical protein
VQRSVCRSGDAVGSYIKGRYPQFLLDYAVSRAAEHFVWGNNDLFARPMID